MFQFQNYSLLFSRFPFLISTIEWFFIRMIIRSNSKLVRTKVLSFFLFKNRVAKVQNSTRFRIFKMFFCCTLFYFLLISFYDGQLWKNLRWWRDRSALVALHKSCVMVFPCLKTERMLVRDVAWLLSDFD